MGAEDRGNWGSNTRLAHGGNDPFDYHGFVNPPIVRASTVLYERAETMVNRSQRYTYGTRGTPTTDALARAIDDLEASAGTIIVPSGLAAVVVPLLAFLSAGDHVLITDACYHPTRNFADTMLRRMGVAVEYYDPEIGAGIEALLRPTTKVLFLESPASNTMEMQDVPALVAAAKARGVLTMIDNTWATPLYFRPLDFGIDISIHAATKYPAGHSDVLLGTVSANASCWKQLQETFFTMGCCSGPEEVYQVLRGLRTMGVRLEHHQRSALEIASWLEGQPGVAQVLHPGLPSHRGHALWKRDMRGSSGLFTIVLDGGGQNAQHAFLDALSIIGRGYSWGGFESLAVPVWLGDRTVSKRSFAGPLIRLHIGLEDVEDLKSELSRALTAARTV